ncbi:hypothetical protein Barb7_00802 [Bacteroidales bacterium Barb7]|nr:hypothetical protein Barb7_00802 [Bacteroidales bacterium Barb7]
MVSIAKLDVLFGFCLLDTIQFQRHKNGIFLIAFFQETDLTFIHYQRAFLAESFQSSAIRTWFYRKRVRLFNRCNFGNNRILCGC